MAAVSCVLPFQDCRATEMTDGTDNDSACRSAKTKEGEKTKITRGGSVEKVTSALKLSV
jgi:hypothetical protein